VKTFLALVCLLCWQIWSHAQPAPGSAAASTNAPALESDKTEMMLRRLRDALTNPAVASPRAMTSGPAITTAPTRAAVQQQRAIATNAVVAAGQVTNPNATPQLNPVTPALPGASPSPTITPMVTARPNANPTNAPLVTAPGVRVPTRAPANVPVQPRTNPGGVPLPGMAAPGPAIPGMAMPTINTNAITVASNLNPNEIAPTIQVQGMEPDQFFEIYSQISGRTVIRKYTLPDLQKITLKAATDLTRQEAVFAMDAVLAQNNVAMIPIGDKFVKAVPMQFAAQEGAPPSRLKPTDYDEAEPFITQLVALKVVKPTDAQQLLSTFTKSPQGITAFDGTQTLVIRDYASNVKRMLEVIQMIDVPPKEPDFKFEVIPVKYGKVIDLYTTMQSLISGGAGGGAAPAQSRYGRQGGAGRFGGMGSRFGGGGYGGYGGSYGGSYGGYGSYGGSYGSSYGGGYAPYDESVERLTPQQVATATPGTTGARGSVGAAQNTFQNRLNQIVRRAASGTGEEVQLLEDARIVPDERSNNLLVFANKRDMEMITNIVSKVDVLLAQVLIEAIIMEVNLGDSYKLGVSWAQQPKAFGNGSAGAGVINNGPSFLNGITNFGPSGLPSGVTYFGTIANDWNVAVQALADNSSIHVVSRPRIQTSHAIPGSFFVGETLPYVTGTTAYPGYVGAGAYSSSVIQQANVGFSLFVTPYITPDGLVVMDISQEFSTRGQDVIIDNNPIPIINGRNAESTLTVRDGDTIMMGGFISENRSRDKSGVPFLKDIPGLGALFRSRNDSNQRTELIVLMRARVLRSPEEAAIAASQEKNDLPGVREAERDLRQADRKRKQKMDNGE
jgi:general secretion pathway protein D